MSKKSMVIAGVVALVVVAIAAALLLRPNNASSPTASTTAATSSAASSTTSSTTTSNATTAGPGNVPGKAATTTAGTAPSKTKGGTSTNTGKTVTKIGPFPALPNPEIPAQKAGAPLASGQMLAPLTDAPAGTISGLVAGAVPEGAQYSIVMRPYGIGPSIVLGSRIAIRIDTAKPVGQAPAYSRIVNANLLVLVDTTHGGTVTKGGTYGATLSFRSDGTKLLPILSNAKVAK